MNQSIIKILQFGNLDSNKFDKYAISINIVEFSEMQTLVCQVRLKNCQVLIFGYESIKDLPRIKKLKIFWKYEISPSKTTSLKTWENSKHTFK